MDCERIDLIAYHFDTTNEAERDVAEEHLLSCRACLTAYLALKRQVERTAQGELPTDAARTRLRRDVAKAFPTDRGWSWLARPIPLYQGLAAAAVALAVAVLAPTVARRASSVSLHEGTPVDTSRSSAESVTIY